MACPYFLPDKRAEESPFAHRERLPLGDAYAGHCTAANVAPSAEMLHDCNLGYARCPHLPDERDADAVRFLVRDGAALTVSFVLEKAHAPAAHGILTFNRSTRVFDELHPDPRIQRMAECCIDSHQRRSGSAHPPA